MAQLKDSLNHQLSKMKATITEEVEVRFGNNDDLAVALAESEDRMYVLAATGASAQWLGNYARLGTVVEVERTHPAPELAAAIAQAYREYRKLILIHQSIEICLLLVCKMR